MVPSAWFSMLKSVFADVADSVAAAVAIVTWADSVLTHSAPLVRRIARSGRERKTCAVVPGPSRTLPVPDRLTAASASMPVMTTSP
ncbi:MAG: hypothetical protein M3T49_10210 [Candidatus Eremiobacteraeota bacterium]|nr:hypothetical protein [Candidatus Eremiobacteraeota bacterium]